MYLFKDDLGLAVAGSLLPKIDYTNRLANGITCFYVARFGAKNLVSGKVLTSSFPVGTPQSSIYGLAQQQGGTSYSAGTTNINLGTTQQLFSSDAATIMFIRGIQFNAAGFFPFGFNQGSPYTGIIHFYAPFSDAKIYFDFGNYTGANRITYAGWTPDLYTQHTFIATAGSAGSALFLDGSKVASQGTAISAVLGANNFGTLYSGGDVTTQLVNFVAAATWKRQLSDAEIYSLNSRPFQLLQKNYSHILARDHIIMTSQGHYRFRTDADAVDATPTWGANEDTTYNPGTSNFRLRVKLERS